MVSGIGVDRAEKKLRSVIAAQENWSGSSFLFSLNFVQKKNLKKGGLICPRLELVNFPATGRGIGCAKSVVVSEKVIIIPPSLIITGVYVLENCPSIAGAFESIPPSERTEKVDVQDLLILWLMMQRAAGESSNFYDFLAIGS